MILMNETFMVIVGVDLGYKYLSSISPDDVVEKSEQI